MGTREAPQRSNRSKGRVESERMEAESTLRRLQARGERLLQWFPELKNTWQRDAEPGIEALLGHLQSLGGQVSRRAQETGRDLEARAERVPAELERQAVRGLSPLLSRANLASGSELTDLESRLMQLEARLDPMEETRVRFASELERVQATLAEARVDVTERLREVTVRVAAHDDLRTDLDKLQEHLDALSREQVTRSLEIGKLHDRLVRLEMRMGDVLKEQTAQLGVNQETARKTVELNDALTQSSRDAQEMHARMETAATEARATDSRLTALMSARNADHDELTRFNDLLTGIQQTLRQVDLRLGDLGERYAGVREDLANLSARVSNLELAPTRPVSAAMLTGRTEGH
jgi:chromosome segregation ATPase